MSDRPEFPPQVMLTAASLMAPLAGGATTEAAVANAVPGTVARVISADIATTTLGQAGAADVFVTDASAIQGMNATQLSGGLAIPDSPAGFNVFEFPTPEGIASPINRTNPGFVGEGKALEDFPSSLFLTGLFRPLQRRLSFHPANDVVEAHEDGYR
jgi:hypothetical protein